MNDNIFEKMTNQLRETIDSSVALALHNKNQEVQIVHLIWALLTNTNSVLNQLLNKINVNKAAIELEAKSNTLPANISDFLQKNHVPYFVITNADDRIVSNSEIYGHFGKPVEVDPDDKSMLLQCARSKKVIALKGVGHTEMLQTPHTIARLIYGARYSSATQNWDLQN